MTSSALLATVILFTALALPLTGWLLARLGMLRTNFRGDKIPVGYGLSTLIASSGAFLAFALTPRGPGREPLFMLAVTVSFGLLGFVDDRWGDRSVGGFRGHVRALFAERRVTTGLLKLVGGALVGFLSPWLLLGQTWPQALLSGAVISLSANALNLLDLRPGRAGAVFLVGAALFSLFAWMTLPVTLLILVLLPSLPVYFLDSRGKVMLGDTGSNLLGASLGATLVLLSRADWILILALSLLVALHIVSERWSLTRIIEANPQLRWLDRLTGIR